jgi:EAL and modified HD-GYP domain-containing signal transduction protein
VLGNSLFSIGMENLVDGKKSFINFTQNLLIKKIPLLLSKSTIVVEILEDVKPTPEVLAACREMSQKGYTLALDDFTYAPELAPLLEIANILKLDFQASTLAEIRTLVGLVQKYSHLRLLAEKVETYTQFQSAKELGFDYFQGYFFCKPEIVKGKEIAGSQMSLLQIMAVVNQPDFDFGSIEKLIARDVNLSYKLLRYINSAFFATAREIASIQQALVYMGEVEIRRFVSLVTMSHLAQGKPDELIRMSCIRGKFCELLGSMTRTSVPPDGLFTLGMFSLIDAIVDQPMERVMRELPLADNIKSALVYRKGELIGYLGLIEYYEKGQWAIMGRVADALHLPQEQLPEIYRQACQWSAAFTSVG